MKSVQDYDYEMADQELVGIIFKLQGERQLVLSTNSSAWIELHDKIFKTGMYGMYFSITALERLKWYAKSQLCRFNNRVEIELSLPKQETQIQLMDIKALITIAHYEARFTRAHNVFYAFAETKKLSDTFLVLVCKFYNFPLAWMVVILSCM